MANAVQLDPQQDASKKRAIRRLVAALILLAVAIVGLAVLDRLAQKKSAAMKAGSAMTSRDSHEVRHIVALRQGLPP